MQRTLMTAERRGTMTIWAVVTMGLLLTVAALVVDAAMARASHADLRNAADAAALAGASGIVFGPEEVRARATEFASRNTAAGEPVQLEPEDIEIGRWDPDTRTFTPLPLNQETEGDAVRVIAQRTAARGNPLELAFARIFGTDQTDLGTEAIAIYKPRDIMLVLDLSGSMNDDSEIRHIPKLGRDAIEDNLYQIWQELGAPEYGHMGFDPVYINHNDPYVVRDILGLTGVEFPYDATSPYPQGSWIDYIRYVMQSSYLWQNGYHRRYGMITFVNYLLERLPFHGSTPVLWATTEQPITAVKDAVDVFIDYLQDEDTDDRLGLSTYTSLQMFGELEMSLTEDFEVVRMLTREKQAAHYNGPTNISAGMQLAREQLDNNGRPGTLKMMVLLTDGIANRPGSVSQAKQLVLDEAALAAARNYPIMTISLGAAADAPLMQQVADITGGIHFNIPGGQSVAQYEQELKDVFELIAAQRPLQLVR